MDNSCVDRYLALDADPLVLPANAAVPTHESDFEVRGILQRGRVRGNARADA